MTQIKKIIKPPAKHWVGNGFNVYGYFGEFSAETSPFLMLDYASRKYFEPSNIQRGVGDHPHRGFETVTFAYHGSIAHKDSSGNMDVINSGDVQWMTAGAGIIHQEFFESEFNSRGGDFEMVQLWINLPAKHKMTPPKYQAIKNNQIPKVIIDGLEVKVIAGQLEKTHGIAKTFSELNVFQIESSQQVETLLEFQIPVSHKAMLLVLNGQIELDQTKIEAKNLVILNNNSGQIAIKSNSKYQILFLSGEPIDEPIAHYGPFVMNTQEELIRAMEDFNNGRFGVVA